MRSLILMAVLFAAFGCTSSSQQVPYSTSSGGAGITQSTRSTPGQTCEDSEPQTLEANEPYERTPVDGLYVRFRVPPGWRVSQIQHNYAGLRSGRDSAFITVWCDDGSVQWGVTYYTSEHEQHMTCQQGYQGEPCSTCDRPADYQSYLDDTDDSVYVYLNWTDIDAMYAFEASLALRDGGSCRPSQ